ncbi:hypothetical protein Ancab_036664 [Ancistrocladus abbreviatus]
MKILAACFAIQTARYLGLSPLMFEVDGLTIVHEWECMETSNNEFGMLILDVKMEALTVGITAYMFTVREGNLVAHSLAKYALSQGLKAALNRKQGMGGKLEFAEETAS